jgi:hypothetical protein
MRFGRRRRESKPLVVPSVPVTRFELIEHRRGVRPWGRVLVAENCTVEISLQDNHRTLKVFLSDRESYEQQRQAQAASHARPAEAT